jgi:hypothetical protein
VSMATMKARRLVESAPGTPERPWGRSFEAVN